MRHRLDRHDAVGLGFLSLVEALILALNRTAKFAASTNAQPRYLLPFLVLPLPLRLPLESFWLPTHRQYEAKLPTVENLPMSPVSSMMVSARICPIPRTDLRKLNSALSFTRAVTVCSRTLDLFFGTAHH